MANWNTSIWSNESEIRKTQPTWKDLENLKTAENSAAVGDGANDAGKSQKSDCGKDVAVDELSEDDMWW